MRGKQSPGRLWRRRPSARGRDGRGRQPPVCRPEKVRAWSPPSRTRRLAARERPTTTRTTRPGAARRGQARPGAASHLESQKKSLAARQRVRGDITPHPPLNDGCLPEPVKSAYGVPSGSATPPLDRTRPTRPGYPNLTIVPYAKYVVADPIPAMPPPRTRTKLSNLSPIIPW
jgi:hypothetical protein